jgi:hypothetical protein
VPGTAGGDDQQPAGGQQQRLSRIVLELAPEFVGALHQRNVSRVLEVDLANEAGAAMAGALVVRWGEPFEPQDALATPGQVIGSGTAHAAEPDDDHVRPNRVESHRHAKWTTSNCPLSSATDALSAPSHSKAAFSTLR